MLFQKEATAHAWKLLTEVYGLPPDRLYVTYFEGGFGLPPDLETKNFWLNLGVKENRIIPGNAADNFWGEPSSDRESSIEEADIFNRNGRDRPLRTLH